MDNCEITRMASPFDADTGDFLVLVNDAGQYSLWPAFREPPPGWRRVGVSGARQMCLEWVETNWIEAEPTSRVAAGSSAQR